MRKIAVVTVLFCSLCLLACSQANNAPGSATASPSMGVTSAAATAAFTVCKGTYALCTTAMCTLTGTGASCLCDVKQDAYSAGKNSCAEVPQTAPTPGLAIASRYSPISSTAVCATEATYAMCLDSPCTVDTDISKANCNCTVIKTPNYVVGRGTQTDAMCKTALWSSASFEDVVQITAFLNKQNPQLLPAQPINVVRIVQ
ncbi:MAG: hypothetical protein ACRD9S_11005 [Pyrinomonadaceae bacterium]